jgi:aromatic ring hydroxylase
MFYDDEPTVWRKRAEEVRVQADEMKDPESRRAMYEIAKTYDLLGDRARERLVRNGRLLSEDTGGVR